MLENKQIVEHGDGAKPFVGIRFILLGFDPLKQHKIREKLLEGGGIDAVNYGPDCNHVIVDNLAYVDPICVAARRDGKILVTGLWVDHSFDLGMPVDPTSVMYIPVRDLNGIPGANSLVMCLTGYQRQDREDIMTMVALMGAKFSKPLVATKVTHLICYKFEGEKYELAKKVKKIKLVNHRWLEDCLKAWEMLPEDNYSKSGYELEMEAEAKDSEDETEDVASKADVNIFCPQNTSTENMDSQGQSVMPELSRKSLSLSASKSLGNVGKFSKIQSISGKEIDFENVSLSREASNKPLEMVDISNTKSPGKMSSEVRKSPGKEIDFGNSSLPQDTHNKLLKTPGSGTRSPRNIPTEVPSNTRNGMATSEKVEYTSETANKSPSGEVLKSGSKSYYRSPPQNSSLPLRIESNSGSPSPSNVGKHTVGGFERLQDGSDSGVKIPSRGTLLDFDDGKTASNKKGKTPVSWGSSKSSMLNHEAKRSMGSKLVARIPELLAAGSSIDGSRGLTGDISPKTVPSRFREEVSYSPEGFEKRTSVDLEVNDHSSSGANNFVDEVEMHPSDLQGSEASLPRTNLGSGKMEAGQSDSKVKPSKRKLLAKKTLGSRPTIFKTAKKKGSINLEKTMLENEGTTSLNGAIKKKHANNNVVPDKFNNAPSETKEDIPSGTEPEVPDEIREMEYEGGQNEDKATEVKADEKRLEMEECVAKSMGDGTSGEVEMVACTEKTELMLSESTVDAEGKKSTKGKKRPLTKSKTKKSKDPREEANIRQSEQKAVSGNEEVVTLAGEKVLEMEGRVAKSTGDGSSGEADMTACTEKAELMLLKSTVDAEGKISTKGKKRSLTKSETKESKDPREEANIKQGEKKAVSGNEEVVTLAGKAKTRTCKTANGTDDVEKENKPVKRKALINDAGASEEVASKPVKNPRKGELKAVEASAGSPKSPENLKVKTESASWFILSGHKLQRKEFQKVIKQLKGRVCRDSHNWSYQATHFIVPDPIRRTEKLFAAAASGSWILKTDYLTASKEAGRFLSEEPYEWHKKGLSEDGAINLEAPRKWRLLKKRTGHGAFYGMRIVIYGECIAPPLDTLKRVVKAGDGTILATSPPYTRFLKSGIDFAIVSPGMPRVDIWVQEFLSHQVPCVVADYLVDYVCKPGYSLEKHVQYNTRSWAEKSLKNLIRRVEESEDDVACEACGCCDRGEEMLICGDEKGVEGCGKGMHVDCLDPPLESVPEDDWFCESCCTKNLASTSSRNKASKSNSKKRS